MSPGTELARDFCAGIGPLQLGVVLVFFYNFDHIRGGGARKETFAPGVVLHSLPLCLLFKMSRNV